MTPLDDAGPWRPHVWKQRRDVRAAARLLGRELP